MPSVWTIIVRSSVCSSQPTVRYEHVPWNHKRVKHTPPFAMLLISHYDVSTRCVTIAACLDHIHA